MQTILPQDNESGGLGRSNNFLGNLQRNEKLFQSYDRLIQEQLAERVVEKANDEANCGNKKSKIKIRNQEDY